MNHPKPAIPETQVRLEREGRGRAYLRLESDFGSHDLVTERKIVSRPFGWRLVDFRSEWYGDFARLRELVDHVRRDHEDTALEMVEEQLERRRLVEEALDARVA